MVRILGNNKNAELLRGNYDGVDATGKEVNSSEKQFVAFEPNQIKSATGNIGTFLESNDDIQMAIGGFINKNSLPKGELSALSSALMTKYGNKEDYGCVIHTVNYEYTVNYKGGGEFDIIEYHTIDNSINDNYNEREKEGFPESPNRWSSRNEITKGEYNSDSYNASDRETDGYNAGLDNETLSGESQQTQSDVSSQEHQGRGTRLIKTGADGTVFPRAIEAPDIMQYTTPQGEIYGFIDPETQDMYLDETVISPEHPIHEYTHL